MKKGWIIFLSVIVLIFIALHFLLEPVALHYANKALSDLEGYEGKIQDVDIHLYRGAYRIDSLSILKVGDDDKTRPFFKVNTIEISLCWSSLFRGRIVSDIGMNKSILNFKNDGEEVQDGGENDFVETLENMIPIRINTLEILNGEVHYIDLTSDPEVDVYLININAMAENLGNVDNEEKRLPSQINLSGTTIGNGTLTVDLGMYLLKEIPDFDLALEMDEVDLTDLKDFTEHYANFSFEKGQLYAGVEIVMKDGDFTGYIKPVMENYAVIDLSDDDKSFMRQAWEVLVGATLEIFKNQSKDRFATQIPIEGTANNTDVGVMTTIANVIRNAFVEVFEKDIAGSVQFEDAGRETPEEEEKGFFEKIFSPSDKSEDDNKGTTDDGEEEKDGFFKRIFNPSD